MKQLIISAALICVALSACSDDCNISAKEMKGIVITPSDLKNLDWPSIAQKSGINTIGLAVNPLHADSFSKSESYLDFLAACHEKGIDVEFQQHAMNEFLPRELFKQDSTMFRMDDNGRRTPDFNCCVHSEKALKIIADNAERFARRLVPTNHRYYFWTDDVGNICKCPKCINYSGSDQALIIENTILEAIRKADPEAMLAHLAYRRTLPAPEKIKPADGIFLEFAPFFRIFDKPMSDTTAVFHANATREISMSHNENMKYLKDNLEVFPAETAVILDYWLDVSLFSDWKKPNMAPIPWNSHVVKEDIRTYRSLGINHITSYGVWIDHDYLKKFPETYNYIKEYGSL